MAHPEVTKMREDFKPLFLWKGMKEVRKNKPNFGGHVVYVRDGPTKSLGRILSTGIICI
jgi:hypothetical protein